jgi:hypothetical protein
MNRHTGSDFSHESTHLQRRGNMNRHTRRMNRHTVSMNRHTVSMNRHTGGCGLLAFYQQFTALIHKR